MLSGGGRFFAIMLTGLRLLACSDFLDEKSWVLKLDTSWFDVDCGKFYSDIGCASSKFSLFVGLAPP